MLHCGNMVVHRGRRIKFGQVLPHSEVSPSASSDQRRWINHLPTDPHRSDVEVLSSQKSLAKALLEEDSQTTIEGLLESTISLTESTSDLLLHTWNKRRENPNEATQPKSQWGNTAKRIGFLGYKPEEYKIPQKGAPLLAHTVIGKRLRAASLGDYSRNQWKEFKADSRCQITD